MIKKILSPTDGSAAAMAGVKYAMALAQRHQAALSALFVIDVKLLEGPFVRDLATTIGAAPFLDGQIDFMRIFEERGRIALEQIQALCAAAGTPCETHITMGIVPRVIVDQAELTDLVVMGRGGEHSQWLEGLLGSTTQSVVRRTTVPVLVTGVDAPTAGVLVVAYDGSTHAKRALRAGAAIAGDWDTPLHLLVISSHGDALMEEARTYLQSHPISVEYFKGLPGEPGEAIVGHARACGAGLVVMGAYGHSKLREMFLGSTTAYALNHAPCPVLLIR